MIDFDDLRGKAEEFLEEHADQVDKGIDKAAGMAGKKYGHGSQIEQGADKLKDLLPGGDEEEHDAPAPGQRRSGGPRGTQRNGQAGRRGAAGPGPSGRAGGHPAPGGGQRRPRPGA